jgi:hypothetical protein
MLSTVPPPGGVLGEVRLLFDHIACEQQRLRRLLPS